MSNTRFAIVCVAFSLLVVSITIKLIPPMAGHLNRPVYPATLTAGLMHEEVEWLNDPLASPLKRVEKSPPEPLQTASDLKKIVVVKTINEAAESRLVAKKMISAAKKPAFRSFFARKSAKRVLRVVHRTESAHYPVRQGFSAVSWGVIESSLRTQASLWMGSGISMSFRQGIQDSGLGINLPDGTWPLSVSWGTERVPPPGSFKLPLRHPDSISD